MKFKFRIGSILVPTDDGCAASTVKVIDQLEVIKRSKLRKKPLSLESTYVIKSLNNLTTTPEHTDSIIPDRSDSIAVTREFVENNFRLATPAEKVLYFGKT